MNIYSYIGRNCFILLFCLCLLACSTQDDESKAEEVRKRVDSISDEYIPDSREDIAMLETVVKKNKVILKGRTNRKDLLSDVRGYLKENYNFLDSSIHLPSKTVGKDTFGLVSLSVANLRSEPEHSAQLVTQSLMGMPLKVYDKTDDWYLVRTIEDYIAWLDAGGLNTMDKEEFENWQESDRLIFTEVSGNGYETPGLKNIITDFVLGDVVQLISDEEKYKIRLPDGRIAYANVDQFQRFEEWSESIKTNREKTLEIARELMGRPYLWGGTSVNGMDCSGYTKTVFLKQGMILPRDASQQVKIGKRVPLDDSLSQLKKGDLIFFGKKRDDGSNHITHVAIYMGDGKIIHATGRVKIESLSPDDSLFNVDRYETMLQARRYIGYETREDILTVSESKYYE